MFNADKTASGLNTPGVIEGFQLWRDMFKNGSANIKPSRDAFAIDILCEGETAMQFNGTWAIGTIEEKYPDSNIGVVPYPLPEGGSPSSVAGGWKMVANAGSSNMDEACKYAVYVFGDEDSQNMLEWCTELKFAYPPRKSVVESGSEIYNQGLRAAFTNDIYGTERPELSLPPEVLEIVMDLVQTAWFDTSVSVEDAVEHADKQINDFIASYDGVL